MKVTLLIWPRRKSIVLASGERYELTNDQSDLPGETFLNQFCSTHIHGHGGETFTWTTFPPVIRLPTDRACLRRLQTSREWVQFDKPPRAAHR